MLAFLPGGALHRVCVDTMIPNRNFHMSPMLENMPPHSLLSSSLQLQQIIKVLPKKCIVYVKGKVLSSLNYQKTDRFHLKNSIAAPYRFAYGFLIGWCGDCVVLNFPAHLSTNKTCREHFCAAVASLESIMVKRQKNKA